MEQFLCLKASAGSGKTFALTVRYISLLLQDVDVTSILTLTFTNKAALEMSQRIYNTLNSLGDDKDILEQISKNIVLSQEDIVAQKDKLLQKFITSELSIYTIDKFINKILREFGGYINLSDDFIIGNDDEDLMLYKFLLSLESVEFEHLVNFSNSYDKKLDDIVKLFKILDIKNEIYTVEQFDTSLIGLVSTTILEAASKIKQYVIKSNLSDSGKKSVDFDDIETLLDKGKTWLTKDSLSGFSLFKKDKNIDSLDDYFNIIKENLPFYFKLKQQSMLNMLFTIFNNFKTFRLDYKNKKNQFEFSDITNFVYQLMQKHIDKDFLYFRLDTRFNHMLIDEFQDTSVLQYKILEPLIKEILSGSNEVYKTFFYVGDIKQSIYRFRGGNKELFDFILKQYPQISLEILETNYRSSKNIINFVNNTFNNLLDYEYYNQKIAKNIDGYVEILPFDTEKDEVFLDIKNKLVELIKQGIDPNNIAILTYTNKDVQELYQYLSKSLPDIKLVTELSAKLINQPNISAVINYIKYIYFKEDIYKANFNALMGYNLDNNLQYNYDLTLITPYELVYNIAFAYNIIDDNMIKFLELVLSYTTIVDFIYEIDIDDTTMINKEKIGLQILTIYKSKGLEFDTILLLDRVRRKNYDKSLLLFEYNNIELSNIYYKMKYRDKFDSQYINALENEKKLIRSDDLNVLYVAFTRAKHNLIIFKKEEKSVFDILNLQTNYMVGQLYIINKPNIDIDITKAVYIPIDLGVQDIVKVDNVEDKDNIKARFFGIATHYCLEMMSAFNLDALNYNIKLLESKFGYILNNDDIAQIYHRIKLLIENPIFIKLLEHSSYTKEQELSFNNEIKIIDLLIQTDSKFIIVDYKTSKKNTQSHIKQVNYYKQAILKLIPNKKVDGYLVYLLENNIEIIKI